MRHEILRSTHRAIGASLCADSSRTDFASRSSASSRSSGRPFSANGSRLDAGAATVFEIPPRLRISPIGPVAISPPRSWSVLTARCTDSGLAACASRIRFSCDFANTRFPENDTHGDDGSMPNSCAFARFRISPNDSTIETVSEFLNRPIARATSGYRSRDAATTNRLIPARSQLIISRSKSGRPKTALSARSGAAIRAVSINCRLIRTRFPPSSTIGVTVT